MEINNESREKEPVTTSNTLLNQTRAIMELEQSLTSKLERVEPWISDAPFHPHRPRVRPIPTNMTEALNILSVARTLSNRTSAPAGWNPAAPVVNFSTPNPLPHQLRGGALAALQLERAKQAESEKKRQKLEHSHEQPDALADNDDNKNKPPPSTKRGASTTKAPKPSHYRQTKPQQQVVSMNLSDSSSSEEDDNE